MKHQIENQAEPPLYSWQVETGSQRIRQMRSSDAAVEIQYVNGIETQIVELPAIEPVNDKMWKKLSYRARTMRVIDA